MLVADSGSPVAEAFMEMARSAAANASVLSFREGVSQLELTQISDRRGGQE